MKEDEVHKTTFRTHEGHYELFMNEVFKPFLRRFVLIFFDDILVYSPTMADHVQDLAIALETLAQYQLYANAKKCEIGKSRVAYLGRIVSGEGVAVDADKIRGMQEWPLPQNLKQLRGFLGLTGYYRRFIRNYAHMVEPLKQQLRKDQFN